MVQSEASSKFFGAAAHVAIHRFKPPLYQRANELHQQAKRARGHGQSRADARQMTAGRPRSPPEPEPEPDTSIRLVAHIHPSWPRLTVP
jgi:hypothetical protein